MLDRQPTLRGQLVDLRPLHPDDWNALFAVASDPEIWAMHPAHDRWQEPVFRAFFDNALAQGGALLVTERASGRVIGSSRFQRHDPAGGGSVEVGWTFLARDTWGRGHNRDMKRLMLAHALASVARVDFRVGAQNWRSRHAVEGIGARLAPERDERSADGELLHVHYEMTGEDFARGPLGAS